MSRTKKSLFNIQNKLILLPVIFIVSLFAIGYFISETVKEKSYDARITMLQNITDVAMHEANLLQRKFNAGQITEAEKHQEFHDYLQSVRFNGDDYFFAYDLEGNNTIHGSKPQLEGKNLIDAKDAYGAYLIRDLIKLAKSSPDGATYKYYYAKPGADIEVPKISYSRYLKDYNMFIGTGVYIDDLEAQHAQFLKGLFFICFTFSVFAVGTCLLIARSIKRPLNSLEKEMSALASGDLSIQIPEARRTDEIGTMAKTVEIFRENGLRVKKLQEEQTTIENRNAAERADILCRIAEDLETTVGSIARDLSTSSSRLAQSAHNMSRIAAETQDQTRVASNAAEESSSNSQSVASAAEEMSCSIAEIATQIERSAEISQEASNRAEETSATVLALSAEASKIGEVIDLISAIAEQTNLLALNATIEAARAGDAGKGFAVVASEVKNLAQQTAKATENISDQISSMQAVTQKAVDAISLIRETVHEINSSTALISSSIEQQTAATSEIARNTTEAASENARVSQTVGIITQASQQNEETASEIASTTDELSEQAQRLLREVETFSATIKTQVA